MHILKDWKARRAGGRITVNGRKAFEDGSLGDPIKLVGVDVIEPRDGKIIATDKDGNEHQLAV